MRKAGWRIGSYVSTSLFFAKQDNVPEVGFRYVTESDITGQFLPALRCVDFERFDNYISSIFHRTLCPTSLTAKF